MTDIKDFADHSAVLADFVGVQASGGAGGKETLTDAFALIVQGVAIIGQVVEDTEATVQTGTTLHVEDDTIPQNTEGDEYLSQAVTPVNASSTLLIEVEVYAAHSVGTTLIAALFVDSTANALEACAHEVTADGLVLLRLTHRVSAASTSVRTYKVRVGGSDAGTTSINGVSASRILGGVMVSSLRVTEYMP